MGLWFVYVDIPTTIVIYNINNVYISNQFDVIIMDNFFSFSFKNKEISKWPQTFKL